MSGLEKRHWQGEIGVLMEKHTSLRDAMGKVSQANKYVLLQFNEYLSKNYPKLRVPNRIALLNFLASKPRLTASGRRNYVIYIRQFCRFLNQRGTRCYMPDKTLVPKITYEPRYYPLNTEHVRELMRRARDRTDHYPIVGETYATFLGLLWCTGMRRKEAAALNHGDVDLNGSVLLVRETKFRKTRYVPFDKATTLALQQYVVRKQSNTFDISGDSPFFVQKDGKRVPVHSVSTMFARMVRAMGLKNERGLYPRIHDLRHNFATQTLKRFYSDTDRFPPHSYLPTLATYLGHVDMRFSQYYLHPDFELMMMANKKFETNMRKVR